MKDKKGLVLEGGGFRGMYTCGVIDVFMENDIEFEIYFKEEEEDE